MPRNGAGVFSLVNNTWFPPVTGVLATSTDWSTFISDIASTLTQSVSSDGQTPFTGNLPMGNNKITGLAPGTATTDAVNLSQVNSNAGQCRLVKSGANLILTPFQGNRLTINGVVYTIPAAGVTLAPTGSVASTVYNIYAFMVGAVMTLEYSTTAHATDATTGVEIKSGDATRTLVGKARPITGPAWQDVDTQRFVISWFNRLPNRIYNSLSSSQTSGSLTPVNIIAAMEFLTWGTPIPVSFVGSVSNTTGNQSTSTALGLNTTTGFSHSPFLYQAYTNFVSGGASGGSIFVPAEGYNFIALQGLVSGGSGTWNSGLEMSGLIQG